MSGKIVSAGPDLGKRFQLLDQVGEQFGRDKVEKILKDDPALKEAWQLQLVNEVEKQFGKDKVETLLGDEPELKQKWKELSDSHDLEKEVASPSPDKVWYLAPVLFSIFGGLVAYVAVKDKDKSMAETCLGMGFLVLIVWLLLLFAF